MACNFSISFAGPAAGILEKAKSAIEGQGGNFSGDLTSGNFSVQVMGNISGSYSVTGQVLNINIDSKPLFISCNQIESFMKSRFQ